jgi:hypothetical protein
VNGARTATPMIRDTAVSELAGGPAPLHPRDDTFPGEVLLQIAADALDWCDASRADPLALEGMPQRFLPECVFPGRQNKKLQFAALAAAALHGGAEPDLLDEVAWWQTDDFWQYALYAAVAYIRAAASRVGVPVRQVCHELAAARADLRGGPQPQLQATRRCYRRRIRPMGSITPAGVHPHRPDPAVPARPGPGDRRPDHRGRPACQAVAPATRRAVRLRLRPGRRLGTPVHGRHTADRPGRGTWNRARPAAAVLGLGRHPRPVPPTVARRRRPVTPATGSRARRPSAASPALGARRLTAEAQAVRLSHVSAQPAHHPPAPPRPRRPDHPDRCHSRPIQSAPSRPTERRLGACSPSLDVATTPAVASGSR